MLLLLGLFVASTRADLEMNFYAKSCPKAEKIVLDYVNKHIPNAPSLAAALIRMHFHDCFVSTGNQTEKVAPPNQTVRGYDFIDRIKSLLEAECPGVVSCADIVSLVARDAIVATGGPFWRVPTGRRDGVISNASEDLAQIPAPFSNFSTLQTDFANKGLNLKDLVVLSGAHTIGISHCTAVNGFQNQVDYYWNPGGSLNNFFQEFAESMEKMGRIGVKTGSAGEIRKHCAVVNS
ncbi:hypothetical protein DH2020_031392 [Rehmannia glutinosa]|uniref:peroxidase n=1 Tax=Rehmannia glutinosa TaxID=99300 RepID=A0ABR0VKG1_REHGL